MHLPTSTYHRPAHLGEALACVAEAGTVVLCGGTDFFPERRHGHLQETIVDISGVAELAGITRTAAGWRIGAATTWHDVRRADLPAAFDALRDAARRVGGTQIQRAGTVGGNLCTASPAGDGVPPLLVLDAAVELRSATSERALPLSEFLTGYRRTAMRPGELLTAVLVPEPPRALQSAFVKLGSRSHLVISIAMVAAAVVVDDGVISDARVAVGACSPVAQRLRGVEAALVGVPCQRAAVIEAVCPVRLDELAPIDDVRATAGYRRAVVPELVADAVVACGRLP